MKIFVCFGLFIAQATMAGEIAIPHERISRFKDKYSPWLDQGNDLMSKIVDAKGEGDPSLKGTTNFRTVLHGVLYRGGTAASLDPNYDPKAPPLDQPALERLCSEEYGSVVYLYKSALPEGPFFCIRKNEQEGAVTYKSKVAVEVTRERVAIPNPEIIRELLVSIKDSAEGRSSDPIYIHCWTGRHASGFMSAIALKQYCGFSSDEASRYWADGTDGASNFPSFYEGIKSFKPLPELMISKEIQDLICPENPYHVE